MAQLAVHLFDRESGRFTPRERVVDCYPYYPNAEQIGDFRGTRIFDSLDSGNPGVNAGEDVIAVVPVFPC